jgi:5-formyltetrahydrofolate cyclo-ligase
MPDFLADAERSRLAKVALRNRVIASRKSMTPAHRRSAAASIHATLLALVRRTRPATIAAYVPVGTEPGGDLPALLAPHARLLLPVLRPDGDLDWVAYDGTLRPGPRGLLEPAGPRLGAAAVGAATLVVVPALAVDRAGVRMGRGGGSYDRVLGRLMLGRRTDPMTVALLHDGELVESVPAEPHDRAVRATITPGGGLALSAASEWTN